MNLHQILFLLPFLSLSFVIQPLKNFAKPLAAIFPWGVDHLPQFPIIQPDDITAVTSVDHNCAGPHIRMCRHRLAADGAIQLAVEFCSVQRLGRIGWGAGPRPPGFYCQTEGAAGQEKPLAIKTLVTPILIVQRSHMEGNPATRAKGTLR